MNNYRENVLQDIVKSSAQLDSRVRLYIEHIQ